jgi:hypothetical protein
MISFLLSRQLKAAGLLWNPAMHDFFAVPDRGMDSRLFVISDMLTNIEFRFGAKMVAFQGASEWALDYLVSSEAVWMPTEEQLREKLGSYLSEETQPAVQLVYRPGWCRCEITHRGRKLVFEAANGSDAYGEALLHVISENDHNGGINAA